MEYFIFEFNSWVENIFYWQISANHLAVASRGRSERRRLTAVLCTAGRAPKRGKALGISGFGSYRALALVLPPA